MRAFKLLHKRKDGSLGPLFINCRQRIPLNEWLQAEAHRRKGYAFRPGWHVMASPHAPHLKLRADRVWCEVEIEDWEPFTRPESQGGRWFLAQRMRVIKEMSPVCPPTIT